MVEQKQVDSVNSHLEKETHQVKPIADITEVKLRWVEVQYGDTDEGDYVFHFSDHHAQRTFPKSPKILQSIVNIITNGLDKILVNKTIEFARTPEDWDKQVFSIKVKDWGSDNFDFDEDRVLETLKSITDKISDVIEASRVRRTF